MKDQRDELIYWLSLHLIQGLGSISFRNLLRHFGSPKGVFEAELSDILEVENIRSEVASRIVRREFLKEPRKVLREIEREGARIITIEDSTYPKLLKEIYDPPMLLYIKGNDIPRNLGFIAMVGSRNPTPYGVKVSKDMAYALARRGMGIVSGLAQGIDSASHWGCIEAGGFTVAVLGTGIDRIYPKSNKELFDKIVKTGCVITEFPPGTPPDARNFPIRNRIISGLSRGVVVVEATKKSGSLITASLALEHGREVFAVPGSIRSFKSAGCHYLLKQGAKLVENADDIMEELGLNYPFVPKRERRGEEIQLPEDSLEKRIYEMIGDYPIHVDEIKNRLKIDFSKLSCTLLNMELKGLIRQLPGNRFVR